MKSRWRRCAAGRNGRAYPQATVQQGGPDHVRADAGLPAPPKMVIVDMDGQSDPVGVTARLVSLCGGDCRLIVIGSANDVALYRRVLTAALWIIW